MNTPPPLPNSTSRTRAPRDGAQSFVTVLAWITIALGALGLAYGLLQVLMSALMPADAYMRMFDPLGTGQVQLPPVLRWTMDHSLALGVFQILASVLLLWLGFGLRRRLEWARLAFIAYLVIGTLMTFGMIWVMPEMMEASFSMQAALRPAGQAPPPSPAGLKIVMTIFSIVMALVFAVLHGGIIWKLCTAPVRVQFRKRALGPTS